MKKLIRVYAVGLLMSGVAFGSNRSIDETMIDMYGPPPSSSQAKPTSSEITDSKSDIVTSTELSEIESRIRTTNIASAHGAIAGVEIEEDFEQEFKSAVSLVAPVKVDTSKISGTIVNIASAEGSLAGVKIKGKFKQVFN